MYTVVHTMLHIHHWNIELYFSYFYFRSIISHISEAKAAIVTNNATIYSHAYFQLSTWWAYILIRTFTTVSKYINHIFVFPFQWRRGFNSLMYELSWNPYEICRNNSKLFFVCVLKFVKSFLFTEEKKFRIPTEQS